MTPGTQINLGLTEFIVQLVRETFTSVVSAQLEQERQMEEIVSAATDEAAASRSVADADIDRELRAQFPDKDVVSGASYVRPGNGTEESPQFAAVLGLTLGPGDSAIKNGERVLTKAGTGRIREHVRQQLAQRAGGAARRLLEQSVPRVRVTAGRIVAKLGLSAISTGVNSPADAQWLAPPNSEPKDGPRPVDRPTLMARPSNAHVRSLLVADDLGGVRIVVSPAGQAEVEHPPQAIGEIELNFSAVIP